VAEIPSGTVTLLFTDIEGSTQLVHQLGEGYGALLNNQRQLLRAAVGAAGGYEVDCRADELFASFQRAKDGVAAALAAQRGLSTHAWPEDARVRVRIGLHTGEPAVEEGAYLGLDVSRAARICSAAHGGQVLLSETTRDLVADTAELKDLGAHSLAGLPRPERIFQLLAPGLQSSFPPLRGESAEPGLLKKILPSRRARVPTLEEEAWQARTLLTKVPQARQKPLTELGAALFTADRAVSKADNFLSRIDRNDLPRRVAAQRESAVVSRVAQKELVSLERQATSVDRLFESRQALAALAAELPGRLDETLAERGIASLRERVAAATAELDEALAQAASALDPRTLKLQRTRHRGVYRSGRKFVVPFVDTVGVDRRREFSTLAEAYDFKQAIRHADNAQRQLPPAFKEREFPEDTWGGIGGVGGGTGT
jgi:class 3 adenylate cyclase